MQFSVPTVVDESDVGAVEQQHLDALRSRLTVLCDGVIERSQAVLVFVVRRRSEIKQRLYVDATKYSLSRFTIKSYFVDKVAYASQTSIVLSI